MRGSSPRGPLALALLLIATTTTVLLLLSPLASAFRIGAPAAARLVSRSAPACYSPATALFSSSSSSSSSSSMSEIKVVHNPDEATLASMGVKSWPTWGCEASKFPWTYGEAETCYILAGKVTVTPNGGKAVTVGKGDLCTFPEGMSCVWDVHEAIKKHYKFH